MAIRDGMIATGLFDTSGGLALTDAGGHALAGLGVDLDAITPRVPPA
ncbi:hypothetical protein GTS_02010 [Gandjariella thermophila]|uniref:Uncharacterized protein n=1 Tax=Gandjariella thermophila TaxID=1931992 RepID=A0A4D4J192_9PSEU|nr:hypothetical protein GTS_02010 [Gandjariella thermophila]